MSTRIWYADQLRYAFRPSNLTYALLECGDLIIGEGISLSDDWYQVDLGVQTLHDLDVQRLQRVSSWLDEENAGVDTIINDVHAVDLVLCIQVRVEALIDVLNDRPPRVVVVDKVTEAGCVHHGQSKTHAVLLNIGTDGLYGNGLGLNVDAWWLALLGRVQRGVEQGVDEGRLSETRLAY